MKYLIVGLGNIGPDYSNTRHNIGFQILDALIEASNISFIDKRYGMVAEYKFKGRTFVLLKPSTYMNRSGLAVDYWMKKTKVPVENVLVLVDDLALPLGALRMRPKGGDGGHNGLSSINQVLGTSNYSRLRFGIGDNFSLGQQVNFVLGKWTSEEERVIKTLYPKCIEAIKNFGTIGLSMTMNRLNTK